MIIFVGGLIGLFLFACVLQVCGYTLGTLIMAARGNLIAKAIVWTVVIAFVGMMLLIYATIG
jgi:hypothetical protein